jgi:hypothetical protein
MALFKYDPIRPSRAAAEFAVSNPYYGYAWFSLVLSDK